MSAHTKGPWHVERRNYDGLDSFVIADAAGTVIATLTFPWENDARLLAAAPKLFETLKEARDVLAVALAWPANESLRSKISVLIMETEGTR